MRENPKVSLEVEEIEDKNSWTTVVVFGRYQEIHQQLGREPRPDSGPSSCSRPVANGGSQRPPKCRGESTTKWWSVEFRSSG